MPATPDPIPSDKQLEVIRFIIEFVEENGFQPTQKEIAAHFKVGVNAIQARLKELARRGIVEMPEGEKVRERALKIAHVRYRVVFSEGV